MTSFNYFRKLFVGTLVLLSVSHVSASSCVDLQNNLSRGNESSEVLALQNFLVTKGFLSVEPNGYFGPSTQKAAINYQSSVGLPASGFVYSLTRASIKKETCDILSSNTPTQITKQNTSSVQTQSQQIGTLQCIDLQNNLMWGNESNDVLNLQNFLKAKGYLSVSPNGYFGPSTLKAVQGYQSNIGLSQSGLVYSETRAAIKNATCRNATTNTSTSSAQIPTNIQNITSTTTGNIVATTSPVILPAVPLTPNQQRQQDTINLLTAMYAYYQDSRGTYPVPNVMSSSSELCSVGISQCGSLVEVSSFLVPRFLSKVPRDPVITGPVSSTTPSTGYWIQRDNNNNIIITAPKATGGVTIMAKCNFNGGCQVATSTIQKLSVDSIYSPVFMSGGVADTSMIIHGAGFETASNTVMLTSRANGRTYYLGDFTSATGTVINATSSFTIGKLSCGDNCSEVPPLGGYDVVIKNSQGFSNPGYISLKSIVAKSFSNGNDVPFRPKTTHMKLGSVTLSSDAPVTLKSLNFVLNGTSSLVSKVSNFTITDTLSDKITNNGPNFSLPTEVISNYYTKIYDLYADIADIDNSYAGRIDINGNFTVVDTFGNRTITVPFPIFTITISY